MEDSENAGRLGADVEFKCAAAQLSRWLSEHRLAMLDVARRYEGGATRAEDIVQDAAIKALSLTDRVPSVVHPRRWLRTITRHAALRAATKRRRRRALLEQGVADPTVDLGRREQGLDDWEIKRVFGERMDAVIDAIRTLSGGQREVVWLRLDGKTDGEIARALGINKSTVRVRWHRAIKKLRSKLTAEENNICSHPPTHPPTHLIYLWTHTTPIKRGQNELAATVPQWRPDLGNYVC